MRKVLFVATTAKYHINIFHLPHIRFLKDNGWTVHVATNGDAEVPLVDKEFKLSLYRNPIRFGNLLAIKKLIDIMKAEKYTFVSCHTPIGGFVARVAAFFSGLHPVIYTAHGFHFYKGMPFTNYLYKVIERLLAHITDVIITMNKEDFEAAKKFSLRNNGTVCKISGIGIDYEKFFFAKVNSGKKREEFGLKSNTKIITNVAQLIKRKDHSTLLRAFAKLNEHDSVLLICGTGHLQKKLKLLAKKLGISHKVMFLGFREDIADILSISDLFVFPSLQEGLPVAVMESMAAGLPIVCSDVRGNRDLIKDGVNGFLVPPKNIDVFAEKMYLLLHDKSVCCEMKMKNRKMAQEYDIKNVISQMKNIYDRVLT